MLDGNHVMSPIMMSAHSAGLRAAPHKRLLFAALYQLVDRRHKEHCEVINSLMITETLPLSNATRRM